VCTYINKVCDWLITGLKITDGWSTDDDRQTWLPTGEFITSQVCLISNIITPSVRIRNRSVDGQATTTATFFATLKFVAHMIKISPDIHFYTM
jgi:hypothetical protein